MINKKFVWFCYLVVFTSTLVFLQTATCFTYFFVAKNICYIPFKYKVVSFNCTVFSRRTVSLCYMTESALIRISGFLQ